MTQFPNSILILFCITRFVSLFFISLILIFSDDHLFYSQFSTLYFVSIQLFYQHYWTSSINAAKSTLWWNIFFSSSSKLTHSTVWYYLWILLDVCSTFSASKGIFYLPIDIIFYLEALLIIFDGSPHSLRFIFITCLFSYLLTLY